MFPGYAMHTCSLLLVRAFYVIADLTIVMQTKPRLSTTTISTLLCLGLVADASGGPPFVTDDPQPVDYQHWEFYIASMHSELGGDWSGTAPHFEVNYGALPDLQLHLIAPLAYDSPPEGVGHYGFGDIELGAKYRFIQETNGLPQAGVCPLLEVPAGSSRDNLGNGHSQAFQPYGCRRVGVRGRRTEGVATASIHFPDTGIGVLPARCCKGRF
jgi:hypothetical protein